MRFAIFPVFILAVTASVLHADDTANQSLAAEKFFAGQILPLLKQRCFACHREDPQGELKGDLDLRTRQAMLKGREPGDHCLIPNQPTESLVYQAIQWDGYELPPAENDRLTATEISYFSQWIASSASWPYEKQFTQLQQEIWDSAEGVATVTSGGQSPDWTHQKYAPDNQWEIPPIRAPEIPDVFGKVVDRLLDFPTSGEQMARQLLNVIRCADPARFRKILSGRPPGETATQFKQHSQTGVKVIEALLS